jgi:hypothetical protein
MTTPVQGSAAKTDRDQGATSSTRRQQRAQRAQGAQGVPGDAKSIPQQRTTKLTEARKYPAGYFFG